ncbi:MAG: hypothetical protein SXG53_14820 [Pseudomonadota bacterium]|nr:hypothetical protein [Pseudomonadota bacterium]
MIDSRTALRFERRPAPVMAEHRPLYKIGQILLVLRLASRAGKSSTARLHLFNWALKRNDRSKKLKEAAEGGELRVTAWGFDPALAIALRFASAERLLRSVTNGYELTDQGEIFADDIVRDNELLGAERTLLVAIGKRITETMVEAVAKGWEAQ